MHTYFSDNIVKEGVLILNEAESHHAVKVMRAKEGINVRVIDGLGSEGFGVISLAHAKKMEVVISEVNFREEKKHKVIVAIAPTKTNDRIEFFIEKATEIGVDIIIPLICKNNERAKIKLDRWEKIALSGTKQSKRLWKPEVRNPLTVDELCDDLSNQEYVKLIAYCEELPEQSVLGFVEEAKSKVILIGPEGDFTKDEVLAAELQGFKRVNLGVNRLRTETAGIVAVTFLNQ